VDALDNEKISGPFFTSLLAPKNIHAGLPFALRFLFDFDRKKNITGKTAPGRVARFVSARSRSVGAVARRIREPRFYQLGAVSDRIKVSFRFTCFANLEISGALINLLVTP
jgi:hypothetical protein